MSMPLEQLVLMVKPDYTAGQQFAFCYWAGPAGNMLKVDKEEYEKFTVPLKDLVLIKKPIFNGTLRMDLFEYNAGLPGLLVDVSEIQFTYLMKLLPRKKRKKQARNDVDDNLYRIEV